MPSIVHKLVATQINRIYNIVALIIIIDINSYNNNPYNISNQIIIIIFLEQSIIKQAQERGNITYSKTTSQIPLKSNTETPLL